MVSSNKLLDLIDLLDHNQQSEHGGRGIATVKTVIWFLKMGKRQQAKDVVSNSMIVLSAYPRIVDILKGSDLWPQCTKS